LPAHLVLKMGLGKAQKDVLDTTPSDGSIQNKSTREVDVMPAHLDWQKGQGKAGKDVLDTTPSDGSIQDKSTRELDTMDPDRDWKAGGSGSFKDVVDTTPSGGSIAMQNTRAYDALPAHLDWHQPRGSSLRDAGPMDTCPSEGSSAIRSSRELVSMPGVFDSLRGGNIISPLGYDTEPSMGKVESQHARDIALNWEPRWRPANPDAKVLTAMSPDCTPTTFTQNLRQLSRLPPEFDWKSSKTVGSSAKPTSTAHEEYVDPCRRLKEFYGRGAPISGRSFKPDKGSKKPTHSPAAAKTPNPTRSTTKAANPSTPTRTRPPGAKQASPPRTHSRMASDGRADSAPAKHSHHGGRLSANMMAFLEGEKKRQQRSGKKARASLSPRSRTISPTSPVQAALLALRIRGRQAAPGTRIPAPSPSGTPPSAYTAGPDSIKENRNGRCSATPTKLPRPTFTPGLLSTPRGGPYAAGAISRTDAPPALQTLNQNQAWAAPEGMGRGGAAQTASML